MRRTIKRKGIEVKYEGRKGLMGKIMDGGLT